MRFRFRPYLNYGEYLGILPGAAGTVRPEQGMLGISVVMDDGREFVLWGECIGVVAEGAD